MGKSSSRIRNSSIDLDSNQNQLERSEELRRNDVCTPRFVWTSFSIADLQPECRIRRRSPHEWERSIWRFDRKHHRGQNRFRSPANVLGKAAPRTRRGQERGPSDSKELERDAETIRNRSKARSISRAARRGSACPFARNRFYAAGSLPAKWKAARGNG